MKNNKGEWSEFYVFLKLLADGRIFAADEDLNRKDNLFYTIVKIIRGELEDLEYVRDSNIVIQDQSGNILSTIPVAEVENYANQFYEGIAEGRVGDRTFELKFASHVLEKFRATKLSDERSGTADIRIVIHDPVTQHEPLLGFSIKSYIGAKPTLFNASKRTNIIYQLLPAPSEQEIEYLEGLDNYGMRIAWLKDNGFSFSYVKMHDETFKANLELIDSRLPEIISHLVLYKYLEVPSGLLELTDLLNQRNPCGFNIELNPNFYTYKIKRFLVDTALGMQASKQWTGNFDANGGYIAVKRDGELLCYHIYNWNDFQTYLLNHTKIDSPSSKHDRCDYGYLLSASDVGEPGGVFMKLNFQIRFK